MDTKSNPLIRNLIDMSFTTALQLKQTTITIEHILHSVFMDQGVSNYFREKGVDVQLLMSELYKFIQQQTPYLQNKMFSNNDDPNIMTGQITAATQKILLDAVLSAKNVGENLSYFHLLDTIFSNAESYASYFMAKYGINKQMIAELATLSLDANKTVFEEFCVNLNEKVKKDSDPLIGRKAELFTIAHTLSKKRKSNVLLTGEPGVGKSQLIEGLAQNINTGKVPNTLKNKIIYSLDVGSVLAGCKFRGDFEGKIKSILAELVKTPNAILFVDEAHQVSAGEGNSGNGLGFAAMLKPELSRGRIKVIAATTWEGYRKTFEKDSALMRRFRVVKIDEPTIEESILILNGLKSGLEKFHNCKIDKEAIKTAVELSVKYQKDRQLPDKAIDIIDAACARKQVNEDKNRSVNKKDIILEITELTGIPIKDEITSVSKNILTIGDELKSKVFHQEKAIDSVYKSLVISQSGLRDPNRPIGSFLFTGPSGVGKSFAAKQIAISMNMHFLKYDMSEYQAEHAISLLIGAPPGYKGFGDSGSGEGKLINDLIKYPNSVLLLDEVEKANSNIFSLLLQMLDEGTITSAGGKTADCRNTIIIMSSNLGNKESMKSKLGFDNSLTGKSEAGKAVDSFFLTEIRGRITDIIEFNKLDSISYRRIVLEKFSKMANLLLDKKVTIIPTENLITKILDMNNEKQYGARKIDGIVNSLVKYPLSIELLQGNIINGSNVVIDWKDNELSISAGNKAINITRKENILEE